MTRGRADEPHQQCGRWFHSIKSRFTQISESYTTLCRQGCVTSSLRYTTSSRRYTTSSLRYTLPGAEAVRAPGARLGPKVLVNGVHVFMRCGQAAVVSGWMRYMRGLCMRPAAGFPSSISRFNLGFDWDFSMFDFWFPAFPCVTSRWRCCISLNVQQSNIITAWLHNNNRL